MYIVRVFYSDTKEAVDSREFAFGSWKEIGYWLDYNYFNDEKYFVTITFKEVK